MQSDDAMDYTMRYRSPFGEMVMASDGKALVGLWFVGQKYFASTLAPQHLERADLPVFDDTRRWLDIYFEGKAPDFTPSLNLRASAFRRDVWQRLLSVPFGQTITYGEIARQIAIKNGVQSVSPQAVGGAVGHNPILLIVPCHRVVGAGGALTGYAAGVDIKRRLLQMEQQL